MPWQRYQGGIAISTRGSKILTAPIEVDEESKNIETWLNTAASLWIDRCSSFPSGKEGIIYQIGKSWKGGLVFVP